MKIQKKLQRISLHPYEAECERMHGLCGKNAIRKENGEITIKRGFMDFSSYFNIFSMEKWKKYTTAEKFFLEISAKGEFCVDIIGYRVKGKKIERVKLARCNYNSDIRQDIKTDIPDCGVSCVSFRISTDAEMSLYSGYYAAEAEEENISAPVIAVVTTTFKKESYIKRNRHILENDIFNNKEFADNFHWIVVDNGRTLDPAETESENISLFYNKNTGGAGGFARGILEAHNKIPNLTHVLLTDDDVKFYPESFFRLYSLLELLRPEYGDSFVGGAMLESGRPYRQTEDIGYINEYGALGGVKPVFDLNKLKDVLLNERIVKAEKNQYQAWWFCCIPSSVANPENLPLPLFVRDDDVEFSLRNKAEIIVLNGICIEHESFEGRFSGAMEWYQGFRNELITQAIHDSIKDIDIFKSVTDIFWQEMYKFNYKGAEFILDAIEDYLKGPDFLGTCNAERIIGEKRNKDNIFRKVTPGMEKMPEYKRIYKYEPLNKIKKLFYDYTCNGQKRITACADKRPGVIPYGWGYSQKKIFFKKKIYAIDKINKKFTVYKKYINRFNALCERYALLMKRHESENQELILRYKKALNFLKTKDFWENYLEM